MTRPLSDLPTLPSLWLRRGRRTCSRPRQGRPASSRLFEPGGSVRRYCKRSLHPGARGRRNRRTGEAGDRVDVAAGLRSAHPLRPCRPPGRGRVSALLLERLRNAVRPPGSRTLLHGPGGVSALLLERLRGAVRPPGSRTLLHGPGGVSALLLESLRGAVRPPGARDAPGRAASPLRCRGGRTACERTARAASGLPSLPPFPSLSISSLSPSFTLPLPFPSHPCRSRPPFARVSVQLCI